MATRTRKAATTKKAAKKTATKKAVAKKVAKKAAKKAAKKVVKKAIKKAVGKTPSRKAVKKSAIKKAAKKPAKKATRQVARKVAEKTAARKAPAKTVAESSPAKQAPAKKAVRKRAAKVAKQAVRKAVAKRVAKKTAVINRRTPASSTRVLDTRTRPPRASLKKKVTPEQALAKTQELLAAKLEHDRQPQPWQLLDETAGHTSDGGFVPLEAAAKANELHLAESRVKAVQGSASVQDRRNQGKRDHRG
jgi:hypothetical protein